MASWFSWSEPHQRIPRREPADVVTDTLMVELSWQLCSKVPPSCCGLVILRFRDAIQASEPEVQEVSTLFRSVLLEAVEQLKEEQEAQRLARQWSNKRTKSMSLVNFRSRIKINPFGSTAGLISAEGTRLSDLSTKTCFFNG